MNRLAGSVLGTLLAVGVAGVALANANSRDDRAAANAADAGPAATATVTRRDLAETQDVSGTLGYGVTEDVSFGGQGTITALPAVGTIVDRGGELGEIDGRRVTLLFGTRPMWRELAAGVTDGPDVLQVEENLIALGHATRAQLGPNSSWTDATTAAVKRWQRATSQEETGVVGTADVVFRAAAVRVAERAAALGGGPGGAVLKVTGTTRQVTINLDAAYQSLVQVDQEVEVELPDGTRTPAKIDSVGAVAEAGEPGQDPTIPVVAVLTDPAAGAGLDQAPVTVRFVTNHASAVLAVPVGALLALSEGGYAVERLIGARTELVGVQLGTFADGWVEVTGDLAEGDKVAVAG